ncbi:MULTISPECIES: amidase [unclassified Mesorhizobium]|uniref:amidase n=1 Tax=unclassified Mesorhizobium TaxID=325217 RepID=UPI003337E3E3
MNLSEYVQYDATGLASLLKTRQVTSGELIRLAREAHNDVNPRVNAVLEFYEDAETVPGADTGFFQGVPFLRKDLGPTEAGRLQEQGSRLFKGYRAPNDSVFFDLARKAGLRTVGRTAVPEFGACGATESFLHGFTRNPWNLERTAGGSSGGAAAAVTAGITPVAHCNDAAGSLRVPAAWGGVLGLLPSRGRISGDNRDTSRSRDFVYCRTVRDMAAALDAFSGPRAGDEFIIVQPTRPYIEELSQRTGMLRVGVARTTWGWIPVEPEILEVVDSTASLLGEMGHQVTEVKPPFDCEEYIKMVFLAHDLGASSLEAEARAMGRTIGPDTLEPINLKYYERGKRLLADCERVLSMSRELEEARKQMKLQVGKAIYAFDILLTPTCSILPHAHGGTWALTDTTLSLEEWVRRSYKGCFLPIFNITGQPAVALPLGESTEGLPIGIQIIGRFGDESTLVRVARDLEEARPWKERRPKIRAGDSRS